jgi:hypothetical protein
MATLPANIAVNVASKTKIYRKPKYGDPHGSL